MGQENNADTPPDTLSERQSPPAGQPGAAPPAQPAQKDPDHPPPNKRPRRRIWFWVVAALAVILAIFLFRRFDAGGASAGKNAAGASPKGGAKGGAQGAAAAITVGQSTAGDMNVYVDALGTVTPIYTVTVYSQITGRVMAVYYREGQIVAKGDPLIDIDPRPYQATLTQAEGSLEHDQGLLAEARIDLQRYQTAFAKNAIAKQQVDDQEQVVVQDEGTVKADQGTVAYDQVQLSYCHIVAPISGRVGLRLVDPGNTIFSGSSSTLVVITQLRPITVVFNVSEDDLPQVQSQLRGGHKLEVDAYDRADEKKIEAGRLTSLDNQVDTATGTVKFRAEFQNKTLSLFPNQFVNARLLVKTLRNVTLVPVAAVQHNGTNAFVYVVKPDNTVAVQQITALTSNDQTTAVQGLNPGAKLATSGFDRLENGAAVLARSPARSQSNTQGHGSNSSPGGSTAP